MTFVARNRPKPSAKAACDCSKARRSPPRTSSRWATRTSPPTATKRSPPPTTRSATRPSHAGKGSYYPNLKRLAGTALEREKDRREVRALLRDPDKTEWQAWYEKAAEQPCTWWVENHIGARHALTTCLSCGMCTSVCPAAEHFEEYDPRCIVDVALSGDEGRLVELLKSDVIWYCAQCGSCNLAMSRTRTTSWASSARCAPWRS